SLLDGKQGGELSPAAARVMGVEYSHHTTARMVRSRQTPRTSTHPHHVPMQTQTVQARCLALVVSFAKCLRRSAEQALGVKIGCPHFGQQLVPVVVSSRASRASHHRSFRNHR